MAAARCSDSHVLAVPGRPSSSSARSVASVATATSTIRRGPMYLGVIVSPSPRMYRGAAHGGSRQPGGRGRSSSFARIASSSAYWSSAGGAGLRSRQLLPHLAAEAEAVRGLLDRPRGRDAPHLLVQGGIAAVAE